MKHVAAFLVAWILWEDMTNVNIEKGTIHGGWYIVNAWESFKECAREQDSRLKSKKTISMRVKQEISRIVVSENRGRVNLLFKRWRRVGGPLYLPSRYG